MPGERRTLIVITITGAMMAVEIVAGVLFGSMALLADGLHMASHATALGIAYFAYVYSRTHARDDSFSFGTSKVNSLAGFTGAVLLAVFAVMMIWQSSGRFLHPVTIRFDQAILVACVGLAVNAACALVLSGRRAGEAEHRHHQDHHHDQRHDHNLRSAYLHVVADALTSVLAVAALVCGRFWGLNWMDPMMGIVGAVLVGNWSAGLIRSTTQVLLDRQGPPSIRDAIRQAIESDGASRVCDLHLWSLGPSGSVALVSLETDAPKSPAEFKQRIPGDLGVVHVTVEVNPRSSQPDHTGR